MSSHSYKNFDLTKIAVAWTGEKYVTEGTTIDMPPMKVVMSRGLKGEGDGGVLKNAKGLPVNYPAKTRDAAKFKCGLAPSPPANLDVAAGRALTAENMAALRVARAIYTEIMRQIYDGRLGPIGAKASASYDLSLVAEWNIAKRMGSTLSFEAFKQELKTDPVKLAAFEVTARDDFMKTVPKGMLDPSNYDPATGKPLPGALVQNNSTLTLWPEWFVWGVPYGETKQKEYPTIPSYVEVPANTNFGDIYEACTAAGLVYTELKYFKYVDGKKVPCPRPPRTYTTKAGKQVTVPDPDFCYFDNSTALAETRLRIVPYFSKQHQNAWGVTYTAEQSLATPYTEEKEAGEEIDSGFDMSSLKRARSADDGASSSSSSSVSEPPVKRAAPVAATGGDESYDVE